jgi:ribosome-associated protein
LEFDLENSTSFNQEQRSQIRAKLASRINKDGILKVTSQRTRSQELNRTDAIERFADLLRDALRTPPRRIPTRISRAAKDRRLEEKRKRTKVKQARSRRGGAIEE